MTAPAATLVRDRIARYAGALGLPARPPDALLTVLDQTFGRPVHDPGYPSNALCPGGWPVEVSFAEADPGALRVDLQPGDPALLAANRAALALRWADVSSRTVDPWRDLLGATGFGGFVGLAAPAQGPVRAKAYLELDHGADLGAVPPPLRAHARRLASVVPGLSPHLIALGDPRGDRLYLEAGQGIALLDLFDWAPNAATTARLPAFVETVRRLTGGLLVLPPSSALLSLRRVPGPADAVELKVELTRQTLTSDAADVVERLLVDRPPSQAHYRRWRAALPAVTTSVVSVLVDTVDTAVDTVGTAGGTPRLNVYADLLEPDRAGARALAGAR